MQLIYVKGSPRLIPSKLYVKYEKACQGICESIWKLKNNLPINFGVAIRIKVWINSWRIPDHVGILQALGDIFQHWDIVLDDKYIHWTDVDYETGEYAHWFQGVDKISPRVEVFIYRYRHPVEEFEANKKTAETDIEPTDVTLEIKPRRRYSRRKTTAKNKISPVKKSWSSKKSKE
jgi:hypothetical protein